MPGSLPLTVQSHGAVDPYWTYVSEVLSQATNLMAVVPVFDEFITAFPSVTTLAEAPVETVISTIATLGNSRQRGRHLKAAATIMVSSHGSQVPSTYEDLLSLPGVGEYTARSVASIAFGVSIPLPPTETNVRRVVSRLLGIPSDTPASIRDVAVTTHLLVTVPVLRPGDHNQALMEMGQRICLSRTPPLCTTCPLQNVCITAMQQALLP